MSDRAVLQIVEVNNMKYPCLVLEKFCNTDISLEIDQEGIDKYGEPLEPVRYTGKCNYQDKAKTVLTSEKKLVQITGTALFPKDICPELAADIRRCCGYLWSRAEGFWRGERRETRTEA